ncbi:MAG: hypothetical protein Q8K59_09240 [Nitrosomonas sp.]|nr:hypothetical protein [Nitrosomonas sp.]MDP1951259.1 hypothetical protein [Nitrosomonas sp.]
MEKITVKNTEGRSLRFTGELIANVESSSNNAHPDYSGSVGHWQELYLWRTARGKFVGQTINFTQWQGSRDSYTAKVCGTVEEVVEFFGSGWLATELYEAADIDTSINLDEAAA